MQSRLVTVLDTILGQAPVLDLNFASSKTLDSRITFSRGSSATFINSSGLVESAASGSARFTHDPVTLASLGLLIEESRINVLVRSDGFEDATWTKNAITATASAGTSPDGTNNARSLVPSTASSGHNILQFVTKAASAITYTVSVFAKANGYNFVGFRIDDGGANGAYACYNVSSGTVSTAASTSGTGFSGASASVISHPNGWYRLLLTFTSNTGTTIRPVITVQDATGNPFTYSFAGNGTSGVLMWGSQIEAGAFVTSYIPTTTASATRAADVATMSGTNFSSWYNQSEGTLVTDNIFITNTNPNGSNVYFVSDGGLSNRYNFSAFGGQMNFFSSSGGTTQVDTNISPPSAGTLVRSSFAYALNNYGMVINGTLATDTVATVPTVNQIQIGGVPSLSAFVNGPIARIRYFRRRLPNASLQTLTT